MKYAQIAFTNNADNSYLRTVSVISDALSALDNNEILLPVRYSDVESGMGAIAKAMKNNDVVIIYACQDLFIDAKLTICKAFSFDMIHSEAVLQRLKNENPDDNDAFHTLMPKNSTPFPLEGGLYSGFAIHSREQTIMFLPLEAERIYPTMRKYVFPYVKRVYGLNLGRFADFQIRYACKYLDHDLHSYEPQIAIAATDFSKHIAKAAKNIIGWEKYVSYAPYEKKKMSRSDDAAAVWARAAYNADLGVSVVEIDSSDDRFRVRMVVASETKALVRTMSSVPDETHEDFMHTVTAELFLMLSDLIANPSVLDGMGEKTGKKKRSISPAFIVVCILLFALSFVATYGTYLYFSRNDLFMAYVSHVPFLANLFT